jgi:transcriptional regulator with XRE-family HTH domain
MSEDKEAAAIGKRVRKLRKAQHLTQIQLANKAGIASNTLALIEQGKQHAAEQSIKKLSKALSVKSEAILGY